MAEETFSGVAQVTVILDGLSNTFELHSSGKSILDAALDRGIDAPFSCKGGVCTTCRAKLKEGKIHMDENFALTDREVNEGNILCCQSHPRSERITISWDE